MKIIVLDVETIGLPGFTHARATLTDIQPRMVQLSWIVYNGRGEELKRQNHIIYPENFSIPPFNEQYHGISTERAKREGKPLREVINLFLQDLNEAEYIVGHSIESDVDYIAAEMVRLGMEPVIYEKKKICTMKSSKEFCRINHPRRPGFKYPKLSELYEILFGKSFKNQHDAIADAQATADCFWELVTLGIIELHGN